MQSLKFLQLQATDNDKLSSTNMNSMCSAKLKTHRGFPKLRDTFFGAPMIRTIAY